METNKTGFVNGFFDCREYKKGTKRSERKMVADGTRVNLSVGFEENQLTDAIREFAHLHEKSGRWFANFKVFPKNCKAYTASAKEIQFPTNDKIDGYTFEVNIDFSVKHGTGTELNGLYANKIQFIKKVDNSFEVVSGATDDIFLEKMQSSLNEITVEEEKSDLPF